MKQIVAKNKEFIKKFMVDGFRDINNQKLNTEILIIHQLLSSEFIYVSDNYSQYTNHILNNLLDAKAIEIIDIN